MTKEEIDNIELPAHSYESEKALLSCIMQDNKILYYLKNFSKGHFFDKDFRKIFGIMLEYHEHNKLIDAITLNDKFDDIDLLWNITSYSITSLNYKGYADTVELNKSLRGLDKMANNVKGMVKNKDPIDKINIVLKKGIEGSYLNDDKIKTIEVGTIDRMMEYIQNVEDKKNGINDMAISTGLVGLDKVMNGGLKPGAFNILAARPGIGKSSLALNILENVCKQGKIGIFFSMEMPESQIIDRLISKNSGIEMGKILNADLTQDNINTISEAGENITKYKLYINDKGGLNVDNIRAAIMESDEKPDVIVVDYIQLMSSTTKTNNETQEITNITKGLKQISLEFKLCVIGLSQLNRGVESRPDKKPMLSDLRGSGSLEQDGDLIISMFRDDYYDPDSDIPNILELNVLKNRHGELGTIYTHFDRTIQSITDSTYTGDGF